MVGLKVKGRNGGGELDPEPFVLFTSTRTRLVAFPPVSVRRLTATPDTSLDRDSLTLNMPYSVAHGSPALSAAGTEAI